jgi:hypothetical protein
MCVKRRHGGVVEKVRIQGLATPGPGGRWEVQSRTRPCLRSRVRQEWRGGKDQDVRTSLIHIIVVKKKGDISVDHLYQRALRMVEGCMHGAKPGQPKGEKKHHDTTEIMIAALLHVLSSTSHGCTQMGI